MDTAREQCPDIILEPTVLHCHRQGLTIQILLEREHRHVQRVPAWISQLQGNVLVPLSVQEVLSVQPQPRVGSRAYSATGANRQASTTHMTRRRLMDASTSASKRHRSDEGAYQNRRRRFPSSPRTRRGVAAVVTVNTSPRPREKRRWGPSMKRRPRRVLEVTASSVSGPIIPLRRR